MGCVKAKVLKAKVLRSYVDRNTACAYHDAVASTSSRLHRGGTGHQQHSFLNLGRGWLHGKSDLHRALMRDA